MQNCFYVKTYLIISNISQLLPPVRCWPSENSKLLIVFYHSGNFGQALCIRSCHEDLILTRKSHNCFGIAFIQGDSAGGSKLIEQTILTFKLNLLPEYHSVFYVTLHGNLVSQHLQTYGRIFYLLDFEVPELSSTWCIFHFWWKFSKKASIWL